MSFLSEADRDSFRMRLYRRRDRDRKQAAIALGKAEAYKGLSPYDCLIVKYLPHETKIIMHVIAGLQGVSILDDENNPTAEEI